MAEALRSLASESGPRSSHIRLKYAFRREIRALTVSPTVSFASLQAQFRQLTEQMAGDGGTAPRDGMRLVMRYLDEENAEISILDDRDLSECWHFYFEELRPTGKKLKIFLEYLGDGEAPSSISESQDHLPPNWGTATLITQLNPTPYHRTISESHGPPPMRASVSASRQGMSMGILALGGKEDTPALTVEQTSSPSKDANAPSPTAPTEQKPNPAEITAVRGNTPEESALSPNVPAEEMPQVGGWKKGNIIGAGANSRVFFAMNEQTTSLFAVKQVPLDLKNPEHKARIRLLEKEIELVRQHQHVNIVRYLGYELNRKDKVFNIFLEYVPGGSIASLLSKFGCFHEKVVRSYTSQIVRGLHYLHSHMVLHRDIKGGNILVSDKGQVKLADFGCSKKIQQESSGTKSLLLGTALWMAPEVIHPGEYSTGSDIWSVGCTVIEMASGKPPWTLDHRFDNELQAMHFIHSSNEGPSAPRHLGRAALRFLEGCFHREPSMRETCDQLLEHPFITEAPIDMTPPPSNRSSMRLDRNATQETGSCLVTSSSTGFGFDSITSEVTGPTTGVHSMPSTDRQRVGRLSASGNVGAMAKRMLNDAQEGDIHSVRASVADSVAQSMDAETDDCRTGGAEPEVEPLIRPLAPAAPGPVRNQRRHLLDGSPLLGRTAGRRPAEHPEWGSAVTEPQDVRASTGRDPRKPAPLAPLPGGAYLRSAVGDMRSPSLSPAAAMMDRSSTPPCNNEGQDKAEADLEEVPTVDIITGIPSSSHLQDNVATSEVQDTPSMPRAAMVCKEEDINNWLGRKVAELKLRESVEINKPAHGKSPPPTRRASADTNKLSTKGHSPPRTRPSSAHSSGTTSSVRARAVGITPLDPATVMQTGGCFPPPSPADPEPLKHAVGGQEESARPQTTQTVPADPAPADETMIGENEMEAQEKMDWTPLVEEDVDDKESVNYCSEEQENDIHLSTLAAVCAAALLPALLPDEGTLGASGPLGASQTSVGSSGSRRRSRDGYRHATAPSPTTRDVGNKRPPGALVGSSPSLGPAEPPQGGSAGEVADARDLQLAGIPVGRQKSSPTPDLGKGKQKQKRRGSLATKYQETQKGRGKNGNTRASVPLLPQQSVDAVSLLIASASMPPAPNQALAAAAAALLQASSGVVPPRAFTFTSPPAANAQRRREASHEETQRNPSSTRHNGSDIRKRSPPAPPVERVQRSPKRSPQQAVPARQRIDLTKLREQMELSHSANASHSHSSEHPRARTGSAGGQQGRRGVSRPSPQMHAFTGQPRATQYQPEHIDALTMSMLSPPAPPASSGDHGGSPTTITAPSPAGPQPAATGSQSKVVRVQTEGPD